MLVGNKTDLIEGREVEYEEGERKKIELKLDGFCEVSAKTGVGIEKLFKDISRILYNDIFNDNDINSSTKRQIRMENHRRNIRKRKWCC